MLNKIKEKFINIYMFPFLFLPFLFLLVSNLFFSLIVILLLIIYIFYFRKELLYNKFFWIMYYCFLSSQYFLIGYFGGYYENSLFIAKIVVGLFQFLPMFILLLFLANIYNLKIIIKNFKFTIFYFIYLILIMVLYNNLNLDGLVFFRNFSMFIVSFFIGIFLARYISISSYFKYLIPLLLVYALFGYFEQSQGWMFWRDYFNSYFISELKGAGQSMYGMIGNKTTKIYNEVYLRMTSVYYEPHHLSLTLAYFTFIFYALKKTKLLQLKWFVFLQFFIFLFVAFLLTLVKAWYGLFILAFIWLYIIKIIKPKNKKSYFFSMLVINIGIVGILLFVLLNIGLGSTANTHLNAALVVFKFINPVFILFGNGGEFNVLHSDSGFATIIFGIGFVGYFLFLLVLAEMLTYLNRNIHPIKYYMMALVFAWFGTTHLVSSTWSPMASFLLFFLIGLSSRVIKSKEVNLVQNSSN
jgi:hypothetical protein